MARTVSRKPVVKILASAQASGPIALSSRPDPAWLDATATAAGKAYKMAGKTPADMDVAEVHDCFTIAEILILEASFW
jgi:acetyl-CoA C-acetyltransferase